MIHVPKLYIVHTPEGAERTSHVVLLGVVLGINFGRYWTVPGEGRRHKRRLWSIPGYSLEPSIEPRRYLGPGAFTRAPNPSIQMLILAIETAAPMVRKHPLTK